MNAAGTGNDTLNRIQKEIKDTLDREEELRREYAKLTNNNNQSTISIKKVSKKKELNGNGPSTANGHHHRLFTPNPSTRGVMQKFLKMRGKVSPAALKSCRPQNLWPTFADLEPAKIALESGKPIRNGFVPAEEKMRRELQEFQQREQELRMERRKSQPDLMAALAAEESNLKPARSVALLYSSDDLSDISSESVGIKPAKSLAELCDASDDELESPGTHSLIMQFESLKQTQL